MFYIIAFADYSNEISYAVTHDKDKPHSEHIMPEVLDKIALQSINELNKSFFNAHNIKLDSIYVDVRDNNIIEPKKVIDETKCKELFILLGKALPISKIITQLNDDSFIDTTKQFFVSIKELAKEQGREF